MDWRCGSRDRAPALKAQSPESSNPTKKKKEENSVTRCICNYYSKSFRGLVKKKL
jgi:hypothetical protein